MQNWLPSGSANTTHPVNVSGRYVRLNIQTPAQTADTATRIYELRVF